MLDTDKDWDLDTIISLIEKQLEIQIGDIEISYLLDYLTTFEQVSELYEMREEYYYETCIVRKIRDNSNNIRYFKHKSWRSREFYNSYFCLENIVEDYTDLKITEVFPVNIVKYLTEEELSKINNYGT